VGTTRSGVVGLQAAVLKLAAPFFSFPAAGFLSLAVFLVAVTLGCFGASATG
jgi:hypothetical protein